MDQLKNKIITQLESRSGFKPLEVPEEVKSIRWPLGALQLNLYNWRMDKVRKISIMRCSVRIPRLEIFAIEIYPEDDYDLPLLAIDFSCMKKKSFVYMNFIPLFSGPNYYDTHIAPLKEVHARFPIGPAKQAKDWMQPYLTDMTIYAMPDNDRLEQAKECAWQYLRCYLDLLDRTEKITDPGYRQKIATASLSYCDQLSEKDGSRKMLGRLIGMKKADIIFKEVIR